MMMLEVCVPDDGSWLSICYNNLDILAGVGLREGLRVRTPAGIRKAVALT